MNISVQNYLHKETGISSVRRVHISKRKRYHIARQGSKPRLAHLRGEHVWVLTLNLIGKCTNLRVRQYISRDHGATGQVWTKINFGKSIFSQVCTVRYGNLNFTGRVCTENGTLTFVQHGIGIENICTVPVWAGTRY